MFVRVSVAHLSFRLGQMHRSRLCQGFICRGLTDMVARDRILEVHVVEDHLLELLDFGHP